MENEKKILETIDSLIEKIELLKKLKEEEKKIEYPIWEELKELKGCYIDPDSKIRGNGRWSTSAANQNTFIDEQHAKSALAMAKISQLMPYYGGRITDEEWLDSDLKKYLICRELDEIATTERYITWYPITFHTEGQRTAFMSREENIQLLKDYFMI